MVLSRMELPIIFNSGIFLVQNMNGPLAYVPMQLHAKIKILMGHLKF